MAWSTLEQSSTICLINSKNLEVKSVKEADVDEKGPYIWQSEGRKAIKEIRDKKAKGENGVPGNVIKLLGEDGLRLMTHLINNIHETGKWCKDFIEVTMIALKKPEATNCSDHFPISLTAHTAKTVCNMDTTKDYKEN
jgi:hypothetical protein